jgi:oxygen-independent coproporphyrinogen-3 oxidase
MSGLVDLLRSGEYLSYAYSYPHKTAYRALDPAVDLRELWAHEDRSALFLYLHVPFCEQRCGFCNLFTQVKPKSDVERRYLDALERQAEVMRGVLGDARFARLAIGGGTPTHLGADKLDRVLQVARAMGADDVPSSLEVSPPTLDEEKLAVIRAHRITRVSMGVQSMFEAETAGVQRRQDPKRVEAAMRLLAPIAVRNVDLIYGLPGQSASSLCDSIDRVIDLGANELYLYPLYVRPLTILGRRPAGWSDERLALYRSARAHLLERGWAQASMRMFTAPGASDYGPAYRCQDDAMIGLGPGARSYTRALHYATSFAVEQAAIRDRIDQWCALSPADHASARHGYRLDASEQRRRYLILSLLERGVDRSAYRTRFGADVLEHFPEIFELVALELGSIDSELIRLNERGIESADVLGFWLQSDAVRNARDRWAPV